MVHERSQRDGNREWWTLPGGGIDPGETPEDAVRRKVLEEVGLVVKEAHFVLDTPYPSGMTSVFAVTVADGSRSSGRTSAGRCRSVSTGGRCPRWARAGRACRSRR